MGLAQLGLQAKPFNFLRYALSCFFIEPIVILCSQILENNTILKDMVYCNEHGMSHCHIGTLWSTMGTDSHILGIKVRFLIFYSCMQQVINVSPQEKFPFLVLLDLRFFDFHLLGTILQGRNVYLCKTFHVCKTEMSLRLYCLAGHILIALKSLESGHKLSISSSRQICSFVTKWARSSFIILRGAEANAFRSSIY